MCIRKKLKSLIHVWLFETPLPKKRKEKKKETPWTVARQAPPSMGFSRQAYWSGCHSLLQVICIKYFQIVAVFIIIINIIINIYNY